MHQLDIACCSNASKHKPAASGIARWPTEHQNTYGWVQMLNAARPGTQAYRRGKFATQKDTLHELVLIPSAAEIRQEMLEHASTTARSSYLSALSSEMLTPPQSRIWQTPPAQPALATPGPRLRAACLHSFRYPACMRLGHSPACHPPPVTAFTLQVQEGVTSGWRDDHVCYQTCVTEPTCMLTDLASSS